MAREDKRSSGLAQTLGASAGPTRLRRLGFVLRVAGTLGGLAYVATRVDFTAAADALGRISIGAFALAIGLVGLNVVVGAVRWRFVMVAYGASAMPPLPRLVRLSLVAFFFNNYLPGAVAGDVGRAVVTRDAFGDAGTTGALAVVFVERALGLFALFALLALGLVLAGDGSATVTALWWWTAIGGAGSLVLVAAIAGTRRLAARLPKFLARFAGRLPALHDRRAFAIALGLSLATQLLIATAGWVLLAALAPIDFTASLLVVPLAAATTFLPITVGGAGAREAVYVTLGTALFALPATDALAASLALWLAHLAIGALGGLSPLVRS